MNKMRLVTVGALLICLALLNSRAQAIQSTNYHLDWFTPLTTGGGGTSSSTHYTVSITVGQTVAQTSSSTNYKAGMGFWNGFSVQYRLNLPLVVK